jgi:hypothetical protein
MGAGRLYKTLMKFAAYTLCLLAAPGLFMGPGSNGFFLIIVISTDSG